MLREKYQIQSFEFIVDEGIPAVKNLIPFNSDYFQDRASSSNLVDKVVEYRNNICLNLTIAPHQLIGYTAKGGVVVDLEVSFQKAGHASVPASESAITILTKALQNVANSPQPNMFGTSIEYNFFEGLTPYLPFPVNILTANLWLFGPLVSRLLSLDNKMNANIRTTSAITMVNADKRWQRTFFFII